MSPVQGLQDLEPSQRALVQKCLDDPQSLTVAERAALQASPRCLELVEELDRVRRELDRTGEAARNEILAHARRGGPGIGVPRPLLIAVAVAALLAVWLLIRTPGDDGADGERDFPLSENLALSSHADGEDVRLRWSTAPQPGVKLRILLLREDGSEVSRIESEEPGTSYLLRRREIPDCPRSFRAVVELVDTSQQVTHTGSLPIRWP